MRKLDAELARLGKLHEFHSYANAAHAFANFGSANYREQTAIGVLAAHVWIFFSASQRGVTTSRSKSSNRSNRSKCQMEEPSVNKS